MLSDWIMIYGRVVILHSVTVSLGNGLTLLEPYLTAVYAMAGNLLYYHPIAYVAQSILWSMP